MSRLLTRVRTQRWEQIVKDARETLDVGGMTVTIGVDLVLEMDRYVNQLREKMLEKMVFVSFGCKSDHSEEEKDFDTCTHCGLPIEGGEIMDNFGRYHPYCHGAGNRKGYP